MVLSPFYPVTVKMSLLLRNNRFSYGVKDSPLDSDLRFNGLQGPREGLLFRTSQTSFTEVDEDCIVVEIFLL